MIYKRFNLIVNLVLLLSALGAVAQQTAYESDVVKKNGIVYLEGEPFTGWLLSDESGVPNNCDCTLKVQYKNGKINGKKTEWYKNGVLKYTGSYTRGYKYGTHMYYYPNANPKLKVVYRKGTVHKIYYRRDGSRKKYEKWRNGSLIRSERCTSDMGDCIMKFSSEDNEVEEYEDRDEVKITSGSKKVIILSSDDEEIEPQDLPEGKLVILFPNLKVKRVIYYDRGYKVADSIYYNSNYINDVDNKKYYQEQMCKEIEEIINLIEQKIRGKN